MVAPHIRPPGLSEDRALPYGVLDTSFQIDRLHLRPPSDVLMPGVIAKLTGKRQRSALHHAVHAFRKAHGFVEQSGYTPAYRAAIARYHKVNLSMPDAEAILKLSTPEVYAAVRQAGRMRNSCPPLSPQFLNTLCVEIRAALVWRAGFEA